MTWPPTNIWLLNSSACVQLKLKFMFTYTYMGLTEASDNWCIMYIDAYIELVWFRMNSKVWFDVLEHSRGRQKKDKHLKTKLMQGLSLRAQGLAGKLGACTWMFDQY